MVKICVQASALIVASLLSCGAFAQQVCAELDNDRDGFIDAQECLGIPVVDSSGAVTKTVFGDPARKDLFLIFAPAASGSLMVKADGTPLDPFVPAQYQVNGSTVTFNGLSALNVNLHVLRPDEVALTRVVSTVSTQKAVRVAESLDTNGTILGNCQWGTPNSLDGCVVYTQRIWNFINATCDAAGDRTTDRRTIFLAYITQSFLHETGHSLGGLTADYNSRFGGYHYKSGSGVVMEQSVTYSTKGGKCTWYISAPWNPLDASSVTLK